MARTAAERAFQISFMWDGRDSLREIQTGLCWAQDSWPAAHVHSRVSETRDKPGALWSREGICRLSLESKTPNFFLPKQLIQKAEPDVTTRWSG